MSRNYKIGNSHHPHFITMSIVRGIDLFAQVLYRDIIITNLKYCQEYKGLVIHAYCIMSNHIHLIISAIEASTLSGIIRDFKSYTSKLLVKVVQANRMDIRKDWIAWIFKDKGVWNRNNKQYQVWEQHNHPIELWSNRFTQQKLDYLHLNPVKDLICRRPEDYVYSSAVDYYTDKKGLLEVDKLVGYDE